MSQRFELTFGGRISHVSRCPAPPVIRAMTIRATGRWLCVPAAQLQLETGAQQSWDSPQQPEHVLRATASLQGSLAVL